MSKTNVISVFWELNLQRRLTDFAFASEVAAAQRATTALANNRPIPALMTISSSGFECCFLGTSGVHGKAPPSFDENASICIYFGIQYRPLETGG